MTTNANLLRCVFAIGALAMLFAALGVTFSGSAKASVETPSTDTHPANAHSATAPPADVHPADVRPGYVGDAACTSCHAKESASYDHTSHKIASQAADRLSVLGSFRPSENLLKTANTDEDRGSGSNLPVLSFSMERKGDQFIETAMTGWGNDLYRRSESIDVVTGSGTRGQTYLYWQGDRLFELPVSYWSDGRRWINSPGYIDGTADFSRPVNPGCMECHASYIKASSNDPTTNKYVKNTLITGLGCETCHGAGAEHVAKYRAAAPVITKGQSLADGLAGGTAILNPAKFSRDLQIDSCAVCHSGTSRTALKPAYSFVPGKPLSEFFAPIEGEAADHPDVHGNQVGLLERSKCFQRSSAMSCSTCHDPHAPEKVASSYSEKCLTCHTWQSCGVSKTQGIAIKKNCIDCHMPVEATNLIVSETAGKTVRAQMRNHWIKVYAVVKSGEKAGL